MSEPEQTPGPEPIVRHARTFALLTFASRVLGLVRDMLIGATLGLTPIGTAFNVAFTIPNTFRRLFGEGALSAAFIPEYAQRLKHDPELSARLLSLVVALVIFVAGAITVIGEGLILVLLSIESVRTSAGELLTLLAIMLPFMPLICATATLGGALQVHGRFAPQAGAPIVLNICMIAALASWGIARGAPALQTAMATGVGVLIAGVLQVIWCALALRSRVRFTRSFRGTRESALRIGRNMVPVLIGLGALQLSTLIDQLIAGYPVAFGDTLPGGGAYPLDSGAGATIALTQRLYQFPLGVFGIALATAAFPALSRQADDAPAFRSTLRGAITLAAFIGIPATAGLAWVAPDLVSVVYERGAIDAEGAARMGRLLVFYTPLVGCASIIAVLTRAFYALGRTSIPTKISLGTISLGVVLNLVLMFPLAERGLALASSVAAGAQLAILALVAHRTLSETGDPLLDARTWRSISRSVFMALVMAGALFALSLVWSRPDESTELPERIVRLIADCAAGAGVYATLAALLARDQLGALLGRDASRSS